MKRQLKEFIEKKANDYMDMVIRNKKSSAHAITPLDIKDAYIKGADTLDKKQWVNIKENENFVPISYDPMVAETITGEYFLVYYSHQDKTYRDYHTKEIVEHIFKLLVL